MNEQANTAIQLDIVEVTGRTLEGVKFLGMIPESAEAEDFNVYVRWDGTKISADRSDTDAQLVASYVTKTVGKVDALKDLFVRLATRYGVTVVVAADPGVKVSAMVGKLIGEYAPAEAPRVTADEISAATDLVETNGRVFVAEVASFGMRRAAFDRAVQRGLLEISPESDGDMRVFTLGYDVVVRTPELITASNPAPQADDMTVPTNTPVIEGCEWKRHVNPGETVWAGSTYQLIEAGSVCQVIATVAHRGNGLWAAQSATWGSAGLTRDFWTGEPLADAFANVVAHMDFLARARAAGISGVDAGRLNWRTWVAPVNVCTLCGRSDTLGRDDQVTPFPHECVTAAQAEAGTFVPALPVRTPGATQLITDADMRHYVASSITGSGASASEYDVVGIVDRLISKYGLIDLDLVPVGEFWDLVEAGEVTPWHGTRTCINCGCDPVTPVAPYLVKRPIRTNLGKRARRAAKRAGRNRGALIGLVAF